MDASSLMYNIRTCLFLSLHGCQQSHVQYPYSSLSYLTWMPAVTCTTSVRVSFLPYMDVSSHMYNIRTCLFLILHGCQQSHVQHLYVSLSCLTWMSAVTCTTSVRVSFLPYMDVSSHMYDIHTCLFLTLHGCQQSHVQHPYVSLSYLTWMPAATCTTSVRVSFLPYMDASSHMYNIRTCLFLILHGCQQSHVQHLYLSLSYLTWMSAVTCMTSVLVSFLPYMDSSSHMYNIHTCLFHCLTWMSAFTCTTSIRVSFLPYMDVSSHMYKLHTCLFLTLHGCQQSHVQHPYLSLSYLTWMPAATCTTSVRVSFLPYMDASSHMYNIRTCLFLTLHGCQQSQVQHPYMSLSYLIWLSAVTCTTSIPVSFLPYMDVSNHMYDIRTCLFLTLHGFQQSHVQHPYVSLSYLTWMSAVTCTTSVRVSFLPYMDVSSHMYNVSSHMYSIHTCLFLALHGCQQSHV